MIELLTIDEVAERLRISRRTAERLIAEGAIASLKVGRLRRISEADLEAYLRHAKRRGRV